MTLERDRFKYSLDFPARRIGGKPESTKARVERAFA
jgi:hypothetical protein